MLNPGPHGFSEILYAFSSAANNNGSAFAGLGTNTHFYNTALGLIMLVGRYWLAIPTLAIAGSLAAKKKVPRRCRDAAHPYASLRGLAPRRGRGASARSASSRLWRLARSSNTSWSH